MSNLQNEYNDSVHRGGFDVNRIFSSIKWFPIPRFKADGLNLITKKSKIRINEEEFIKWDKCYGYISHANDKLTHKGFCRYSITVDDKYNIDIYNVHMDADFRSDPNGDKDLEARQSQVNQLCDYIVDRYYMGDINPAIIIGDTNSYTDRQCDVDTINILLSNINRVLGLTAQEITPANHKDVDRIFCINNYRSSTELRRVSCYYDLDKHMSDHKPLIVELDIKSK